MIDEKIQRFLEMTLEEDLGTAGDITSCSIFGPDDRARAQIASKASGVLSGTWLIEPLFALIGGGVALEIVTVDGARVAQGTIIARLEGPVRAILAAERTALNLLQRLSGVATLTSRFVEAAGSGGARLLDTRKTTPLLRSLEKRAVIDGGGCNHRFGLYDMVLIKDTHVAAAGGVGAAIRRVRAARQGLAVVAIEAEVQNIAQFREALSERPDRIMLDNMTVEDMRACVAIRAQNAPGVELEASGNVTLETVRRVSQTGVDFISVGALTHSAPALDIHLVIV